LKKCLRAIVVCKGVVRAVTDAEILDAKAVIGKFGLGCEPASAATIAGLKHLRAEGIIGDSERVACVLTGHPLKDPNVTVNYHKEKQGMFSNPPIEAPNDLDAIIKLINNLKTLLRQRLCRRVILATPACSSRRRRIWPANIIYVQTCYIHGDLHFFQHDKMVLNYACIRDSQFSADVNLYTHYHRSFSVPCAASSLPGCAIAPCAALLPESGRYINIYLICRNSLPKTSKHSRPPRQKLGNVTPAQFVKVDNKYWKAVSIGICEKLRFQPANGLQNLRLLSIVNWLV
jgi:hypothetical protein